MRKLDSKNKTYMIILSLLTAIVFLVIIVFIVAKFKDMNIKYNISKDSFVYNSENELLKIKEDTYAKKNLLGNYYILINKNKVNITSSAVVYNQNKIQLLGTFYEVLEDGKVNKLKGETVIEDTSVSKIFKIDDRKYLIISKEINSSDGSLKAKDYLLINIDKVGNGYLYNNEINMKTFNELNLVTDNFTFNVNEEMLVKADEKINLAKINGSTNKYKKENTAGENADDNEGSVITNIYHDVKVEKNVVTKEEYVTHKTSILGIETTASTIDINYIVYDPFTEYQELYVNVYENDTFLAKVPLELNLTKHTIGNLKGNTTYRLDYYYSFNDANNNLQTVQFDSTIATTKNILGTITLEKVGQNSVRYKVIVDSSYKLDEAKVALYIDGNLVGINPVNVNEVSTKDGDIGEIIYDYAGDFAYLKLIDCVYNGESIDIDASYKYKL